MKKQVKKADSKMPPSLHSEFEHWTKEKRNGPLREDQHWVKLNRVQQFSLYTLEKVGYELKFVREMPDGALAIISLNKRIVTINELGEIDYNPGIELREDDKNHPKEQ